MSMHKNHPFHLVDISPWPFGAMTMMMGLIKWFHLYNSNLLLIGLTITILIMSEWWRDIIREGTFQGLDTTKVTKGLRWGMILFITSEILFFISFFGDFSTAPNPLELSLDYNDPPKVSLDLTLYHSLMENNYSQGLWGLILTVILGIYFTMLQGYEYMEAPFTISDSVHGSSFFMATGFHGLHVLIGTTFLLICLARHYNNHFSQTHQFGFEAAAWYWPFVDVVWLCLYISLYWWGS